MEIAIAMGLFFIVVTAIFIAVAVFLPEWVGITGKRAKEIMVEQQGDLAPPAPGSLTEQTSDSTANANKITSPHER